MQGAQGVPGPVLGYSPEQIAMLRWYEANELGITYSTGNTPYGICFDGTNIWVANYDDNTVTKRRVSDGSLVGTYSVGVNPRYLCFDGVNIWVANSNASPGTVTKLKASDMVPRARAYSEEMPRRAEAVREMWAA